MRRNALALVAALACACRSAPQARVAAPPAAQRVPPRVATLFYATAPLVDEGLPAFPFPSPLVHGTVGGRATTMIVDTGANVPVVTTWLAEEAGLQGGAPFDGRDSAGRRVPMRRAEHPAIVIDGWDAVPDRTTAIADLPLAFRRAGIGAIVSPQALAAPGERVELDLVAGRMRLVGAGVTGAGAASGALAGGVALRGARICAYEANGIRGRAVVATATIDGVDVALDLDTGTNGIAIGRGTALGRALAPRSNARASGLGARGAFEVARVADVSVRFGAVDTKAVVDVVVGAANGACGTAGRLGMDYLRSCVFSIGDDALEVWCRPPPISTANAACDACMRASCAEPAEACARSPARCNEFATCAGGCAARPCIDACAARAPEGMALNRCLSERCADACTSSGSPPAVSPPAPSGR